MPTITEPRLCPYEFLREDAIRLAHDHANVLAGNQAKNARVSYEAIRYSITPLPEKKNAYCLEVFFNLYDNPVVYQITLPKKITADGLLNAYTKHLKKLVSQFKKEVTTALAAYKRHIANQQQQ